MGLASFNRARRIAAEKAAEAKKSEKENLSPEEKSKLAAEAEKNKEIAAFAEDKGVKKAAKKFGIRQKDVKDVLKAEKKKEDSDEG